jgi:hypothetical protein
MVKASMAKTKQQKGGEARAKALTADKLSDIAKKAAEARWGRKAICEGPVDIGNATLNAAVLADGTRLLSQADFLRSIGRSRSPKAGTGILSSVDDLPFFLRAKALNPFVTNELRSSTAPIFYNSLSGAQQVGYRHDLLPKVCEVYLAFRDHALANTGRVPKQFEHIIEACDLLMRALAHVGITALVDEATGYQYIRARDELQKVLTKYLRDYRAKWAKVFPDEFWIKLFKLKGIEYDPSNMRKPQYVGHWVNNLIYSRLAPGLKTKLQELNPVQGTGTRRDKHHQWLTEDHGVPELRDHLSNTMFLMDIYLADQNPNYKAFEKALDKVKPKFGTTFDLPLEK